MRATSALWPLALLAMACNGGSENTDNDLIALDFEEISLPDAQAMLTELRFVPGGMQALLLAKDGVVTHVEMEGNEAQLLGSFTLPFVYSETDCGLISLAFDPDFADNRLIYVGACLDDRRSGVVRLEFDPSDYAGIPATASEVIVVGDDEAPREWHNVGSIGFDPDGNLWALFGDKRISEHGQDPANNLSALLRVVPNREADGAGYTAATGNATIEGASPDLYAYGFRSPWRGVLDSQGRFWVGDVGANDVEEVNVVTAAGQNFGWDDHEGPCKVGCDGVTDPVVSWDHDGVHTYMNDDREVVPTARRSVYVGLEVQEQEPQRYGGRLDGKVLIGDYCLGFMRALALDAQGELSFDGHVGHLAQVTSMDQGPDGFVYVSTFGICGTSDLDEEQPPVARVFRAVARP